MFSADISWSPVVDEVSIESRSQSHVHPQATALPPKTAKSHSIVSRKEVPDGAESVKSASSGKSRLLRWGKSKLLPLASSPSLLSPPKEDDHSSSSTKDRVAMPSDGAIYEQPPPQAVTSSIIGGGPIEGIAEMSEDRGPVRYELAPVTAESRTRLGPDCGQRVLAGQQHFKPPATESSAKWDASFFAAGPTDETFCQSPTYSIPINMRPHPRPPSSSSVEYSVMTRQTVSSPIAPESLSVSSAPDAVEASTTVSVTPHGPSPITGLSLLQEERREIQNPGHDQIPYSQRLIRRMRNASQETRLCRIREVWNEPLDPVDRLELEFEKELWLFNELVVRHESSTQAYPQAIPSSSGPVMPMPASPKRCARILDIASRPAEVHQLAALQPGARIAHLNRTTTEATTTACCDGTPVTVALLPLSNSNPLALDLADSSFDHVRLTTGVGMFTSPQLRSLIFESYRVLVVRGILEVRFVDLVEPVSAGPKTMAWIRSTLLLELEKAFLCTRPSALIPVWAEQAGFSLLRPSQPEATLGHLLPPGDGAASTGDHQELVVCVNTESASTDELLESLLCQFLSTAQCSSALDNWFWEDEDCRKECVLMKTRFRLTRQYGFKS